MADNDTNTDGTTPVTEAVKVAGSEHAVSKISDWAEMLFGIGALFAGRNLLKEAVGWAEEKLELQKYRVELFRHHKLVVLLRPFLWTAFLINLLVTFAIGAYQLLVITPVGLQDVFGAGYMRGTGLPLGAFVVWLVFQLALDAIILVRYLRTRGIEDPTLDEYLAFIEETLRGLNPDLPTREKRKEVRSALAREFGAKGRLGPWTFFLTFGSYLMTAIFALAVGSWAYGHGVPWVLSAGVLMLVVPVLVSLLGVWTFAVQFVPVAAGAIVSLELLSGLAKVMWDSIATTLLLNVEGDEANQAINVRKYRLGEKAGFLIRLLGSTPAAVVFALYALCGICWPDPLFALPTAAILLALGGASLFSGIMGNDENPGRRKMGLLVKTLCGIGAIYRIVETVYFPNRQMWPVIWAREPDQGRVVGSPTHFTHPITGWAESMWDGLVGADWVTSLVVILLLVGLLVGLIMLLRFIGKQTLDPTSRWVRVLLASIYSMVAIVGIALAILVGSGLTHMVTHGVHVDEVRSEARRAGHELGVGQHGSSSHRTSSPPPRRQPVRRSSRRVSLGRAPAPPIPGDAVASSGGLPSCESAFAPAYRELQRRMHRCR